CADALGNRQRSLEIRLGQEDRELLPAEAGRRVVVAKLPREHLRDAAEDSVAGAVPVGVVHLAEQVEVGDQNRQRAPEPARPTKLRSELGVEVTNVEEACLG